MPSYVGRRASDRARSRVSRRTVLRGSAVGAAGLLSASLIGCGDEAADPAATPIAPTDPTPGVGPGEQGPRRGGVIRGFLSTSEPAHFDVHNGNSFTTTWPMGPCHNQLVQYDPFEEYAIVPDLAHSWEFPDQTTMVFNLNEATYHDGTPFTSEDVRASLDRIRDPAPGDPSPRGAQLSPIDEIETPDERTAVLHLSRPSAALLGLLGSNWMPIYAAHNIHEDAFDHRTDVNGTGPFMLERYDRGSLVLLTRNPNYFEDDLPYLDGIEWHIIPDSVRAFSAFRAGDLDMMSVPATEVNIVENEMPDASMNSAPGMVPYQNIVAVYKEPWNDPRTVLAIGLATDKDAGNEIVLNGRGFVGGLFPPQTAFSLPEMDLMEIPGYAGDMEARRAEARQLLDAAGVPEGYQVTMTGRDLGEDWGVFVTDQLTRIGFNVDLNVYETATWNERRNNREYGDFATSTRGIALPDPDIAFGDALLTDSPRNYNGFSDPELDRMFEEQTAELDHERRVHLSNEMEKRYLNAYPPDVGVWIEHRWAMFDHVQGYGVLYGSHYLSRKFQYVWLDR